MSDEEDVNIFVETEDFLSVYDGEVVWIEFIEDGVTKVINKEDFRDFCKFVSDTQNEYILAEDQDNGEED